MASSRRTDIDRDRVEHGQQDDDDEQAYLAYLAAVQAEHQAILNVFYEAEANNPAPPNPLLTESEILSLFDSGFDIDMILKAYPEFTLDQLKQLKREWSDKQPHKKQKKKKSKQQQFEIEPLSSASSSSLLSAASITSPSQSQQTSNSTHSGSASRSKKKRRRRRSKHVHEVDDDVDSILNENVNAKNKTARTPKHSNVHKKKWQCDWCFQRFSTEKLLKAHFKQNPHMHAAV